MSTGTTITRRTAGRNELLRQARNFSIDVKRTGDSEFTANVRGQAHIAVKAATEIQAVRELKKTVEQQLKDKTLNVVQKMI